MSSVFLTRNKRLLAFILGPVLFGIALALPLGPVFARAGFGMLFWMAWWWMSGYVPFHYTMLVPIIVTALVPFAPPRRVLEVYIDPLALVIVCTVAMGAGMIHWGLAKRIAYRFLLLAGNDAKTQTIFWLVLSTLISTVVADTTVVAMLLPVTIAVLVAVGYKTVEDRSKSITPSNILIAVGWGASIGGFATPLGGGQALVAYRLLGEAIGRKVDFYEWTIRMFPPTLLVMVAVGLYMWFGLKYDDKKLSGSKEFYREELRKMGPPSREEWALSLGYIAGVVVIFTEPLYRGVLPSLDPGYVFFLLLMILFVIPSKTERGTTVMNSSIMKKYFPMTVIYVWPTAIALARLLEVAGSVKVMGGWLAGASGLAPPAMLAVLMTMISIITQVSTNTAAEAIMLPPTIAIAKGMGANVIPWVYGVGLQGNWAFTVASGTGGLAILAGWGGNLRRMFIIGWPAVLIATVVTYAYMYIVAFVVRWSFYFTT